MRETNSFSLSSVLRRAGAAAILVAAAIGRSPGAVPLDAPPESPAPAPAAGIGEAQAKLQAGDAAGAAKILEGVVAARAEERARVAASRRRPPEDQGARPRAGELREAPRAGAGRARWPSTTSA